MAQWGHVAVLGHEQEVVRDRQHEAQGAVEQDVRDGLIPIFCCANVGTTSSCAVDKLPRVAALCARSGAWLHVDAAYAGAACVCEEHRHIFDGVGGADSVCFNLHKWPVAVPRNTWLQRKRCVATATAWMLTVAERFANF